jgi:hypothetical protein
MTALLRGGSVISADLFRSHGSPEHIFTAKLDGALLKLVEDSLYRFHITAAVLRKSEHEANVSGVSARTC